MTAGQDNNTNARTLALRLTRTLIEEADAVLICAGAGMSVKREEYGENVYVSETDFAKHYPFFAGKWGYNTSYQAMGLGFDPHVPIMAKWGLWANHMMNQRWRFTPNQGYNDLFEMVKEKDYFVLTSNVDGCFERSGFDKDRIYTPQGEWTYYQCRKPCRPDAVWKSKPMLEEVLPKMDSEGFIPEQHVPKCPYCQGGVFGNVRADGGFIHRMYDEQNTKIRNWMRKTVDEVSAPGKGKEKKKVVVIEIGAGFNTPMVTRLPVESFVRELSERGRLIRINPSDPEVPDGMNAIAFAEGWGVLGDIEEATPIVERYELEAASAFIQNTQRCEGLVVGLDMTARIHRQFGHFDWDKFLGNLARSK